jgi:hypothetical protein
MSLKAGQVTRRCEAAQQGRTALFHFITTWDLAAAPASPERYVLYLIAASGRVPSSASSVNSESNQGKFDLP